MFKKWDILIYIFLILFSGLIMYSGIRKKEKTAEYVEIYISGKIKYRYKLTKEKKVIEIKVDTGIEKIEIENNKVKKIKSTCKNRNCEKQGWISKAGDSIICIPNKEIIKISGETEDFDYILK